MGRCYLKPQHSLPGIYFFPTMKATLRGVQVGCQTMCYHCSLKSRGQHHDKVAFPGQPSSIKAHLQDAKRFPNPCKVNSLQIIVPFIRCVLLWDCFKVGLFPQLV